MYVIVGVTGGIAAYKTVQLVRLLVLDGHEVHVIPTDAAVRFVAYPDVAPALAELREGGAKLVVVSNWDVSLHPVLEQTGLAGLVVARRRSGIPAGGSTSRR